MFGCLLLLTCTETGESRCLSLLHVKHRKTHPNMTEKLLTGSKNSYMYKRAQKFIQQVEFSGLLYMLKFGRLNPFILDILSHPFQLDKYISNFRVVGLYFSFLLKFKRHFCKQTVENLIRCHVLQRLFCTVCRCPTKKTLGFIWVNKHESDMQCHRFR